MELSNLTKEDESSINYEEEDKIFVNTTKYVSSCVASFSLLAIKEQEKYSIILHLMRESVHRFQDFDRYLSFVKFIPFSLIFYFYAMINFNTIDGLYLTIFFTTLLFSIQLLHSLVNKNYLTFVLTHLLPILAVLAMDDRAKSTIQISVLLSNSLSMLAINLVFAVFLYLTYKILHKVPLIVWFIGVFSIYILSMLTEQYFSTSWLGRFELKNCTSNWGSGLKKFNHPILSSCFIKVPEKCFIENLTNIQFPDFTAFYNLTCKSERDIFHKIEFLQNYNPKLLETSVNRLLAFPLTNKFKIMPNAIYQREVLKNITTFKSSEREKVKAEVMIDYDKSPPKAYVDVIKNEEAVKRAKEYVDDSNVVFKNFLLIYLDGISGPHFKRVLPKTFNWISKLNNLKSIQKVANQYLKYQSINPENTEENIFPIFYNNVKNESELNTTTLNSSNPFNSVVKQFKMNGFITGSASNYCGKEPYDINNSSVTYHNPEIYENVDNEFNSLFCDPNFEELSAKGISTLFSGHKSIIKKCLYGKSTTEWALDYTLKFFETYKTEKKFFKVNLMGGNEETMKAFKYEDKTIVDFLKKLDERKILDSTGVIIYSGSGNNFAGAIKKYKFPDYIKEMSLPLLYFINPLSSNFYNDFMDTIYSNSFSLILADNLYNTLMSNFEQNIDISQVRNAPDSKPKDIIFNTISHLNNCKYMQIFHPNITCLCENKENDFEDDSYSA